MHTIASGKFNDGMKRSIHAPCLYTVHYNNGHTTVNAPAVDCEWNCENCGFNPRVKERRLERIGSC